MPYNHTSAFFGFWKNLLPWNSVGSMISFKLLWHIMMKTRWQQYLKLKLELIAPIHHELIIYSAQTFMHMLLISINRNLLQARLIILPTITKQLNCLSLLASLSALTFHIYLDWFMASSISYLFVTLILSIISLLACTSNAQLSPTFYATSCPNFQRIARDEMTKAVNRQPRNAASILRLFFHDCFVNVRFC